MATDNDVYRDHVEGVPLTLKPELLAGNTWWRVHVDGHPKVLVRHRDHAIRVGELLAADEALLRREREQADRAQW
jgi:hypothetical protein